VREIFNAEIANILLYDSVTNIVHLTYSYSNKYFDDEPPWQLEEGGLTTEIILSGQPLLLNSAQAMEEHNAASYLTAPVDDPDPQSYGCADHDQDRVWRCGRQGLDPCVR
jgi:hypothetical protein